jgi:hypothetical protein
MLIFVGIFTIAVSTSFVRGRGGLVEEIRVHARYTVRALQLELGFVAIRVGASE